MVFSLAMGHLAGLSLKTLRNLPSSSKNHIFYIYIVLLDRLKLYNFFLYTYMNVNEYYILTLAWSVNQFHYEIYTCTEYKSQTIYTHNSGTHMHATQEANRELLKCAKFLR
jgi:hypothetical protein